MCTQAIDRLFREPIAKRCHQRSDPYLACMIGVGGSPQPITASYLRTHRSRKQTRDVNAGAKCEHRCEGSRLNFGGERAGALVKTRLLSRYWAVDPMTNILLFVQYGLFKYFSMLNTSDKKFVCVCPSRYRGFIQFYLIRKACYKYIDNPTFNWDLL